MPELCGISVWLEIEDKRLEEFKAVCDQEANVDRIECWVPCEAGKEFSIVCVLPESRMLQTNHSFEVTLDGRIVDAYGSNFYKEDKDTPEHKRDSRKRYLCEEIIKKGRAVRVFRFGKLDLTDDDAYRMRGEKEGLGEIKVSVNTFENYRDLNCKWQLKPRPSEEIEDYYVHESVKGGIEHCVMPGAEEELEEEMEFIETIDEEPLCIFVFKYRHIDFLLAKNIAPNPIAINQAGSSTSRNAARGFKRELDLDQVRPKDEAEAGTLKTKDWLVANQLQLSPDRIPDHVQPRYASEKEYHIVENLDEETRKSETLVVQPIPGGSKRKRVDVQPRYESEDESIVDKANEEIRRLEAELAAMKKMKKWALSQGVRASKRAKKAIVRGELIDLTL